MIIYRKSAIYIHFLHCGLMMSGTFNFQEYQLSSCSTDLHRDHSNIKKSQFQFPHESCWRDQKKNQGGTSLSIEVSRSTWRHRWIVMAKICSCCNSTVRPPLQHKEHVYLLDVRQTNSELFFFFQKKKIWIQSQLDLAFCWRCPSASCIPIPCF